MNVTIRDADAMKALRPLEVAAYLRSRGWVGGSGQVGRATVWTLRVANESYETVLPLDLAVGDFALRMGDIVRVLAAVEQRSEAAVYADLLTTTADVLRIRIDNAGHQDGTLPIEDYARIGQKARDLFLAAACAATEPRAVWHTRKPSRAVEEVRKVRVGQTERGSYIVTVLTRVGPELHLANGQLFETELPFERRMTQMLATSLSHLERAAEMAALSGEFAAFDAAVSQGVSANLCDAVVGLWGDEDRCRSLEFAFSWSPARSPEVDVVRRVRFSADQLPVIQEAARLLRERAPVVDFELVGAVVKLERTEGSPTGTVTIAHFGDEGPRRVTLELAEPQYHIAVQAHDAGRTLRVLGTLTKDGRAFVLLHPRDVTAEDE